MNKILVCDDNQQVLFLITRALTNAGHQVFPVDNLGDLDAKFETADPSVAIMDYHFDGQDSSNKILDLKKKSNRTVFILISSAENIASIAKELNLIHYLKKPFKLKRLVYKVNELISRKQSQKNSSHR